MLASNIAAVAAIVCIVLAVAELAGGWWGLLVLGLFLTAIAWALKSQATASAADTTTEPEAP